MSGTATVHPEATLRPGKQELLARWLPTQPWFRGNGADVEIVGKWRFEDPAGEVGLDNMLVRSGEDIYYVPVTWRSAPLTGHVELIGELHHSELGRRFCYDGATDPVFLAELRRVIVDGDREADVVTTSGARRQLNVSVRGNGISSDGRPRLVRRLGTYYPGAARLVATWEYAGVEREDLVATIA